MGQMKALARVLGLLFCASLLVAIVPYGSDMPVPSSEHLVVAPPPVAPTVQSTLVSAPSDIPIGTDGAIAAATPAPPPSPTLVSEDMVRELRAVRSEVKSRVEPTATEPELPTLDLYIHLPPQAVEGRPLRVLLALHGMGGNGAGFAKNLVADADVNGWVVIAPTLPYNSDYMNWAQLREEDIRLSRTLHHLLDGLPERLGLKLYHHVFVYGFSRGAQLGHRFALLYPGYVETVAAISAGSYTMPVEKRTEGNTLALVPFPFGVGDLPAQIGLAVDWTDLKRVSFWVGVGAKDNRAADVPRAFDPYCGRTRVERASAFNSALQAIGIDTRLFIFPNADHEITTDMRNSALGFIRQDEQVDNWNN